MSNDSNDRLVRFTMLSIAGAFIYVVHKHLSKKKDAPPPTNPTTAEQGTQTEISQVDEPVFMTGANNYPDNFFDNSSYPSVTGQIDLTEITDEEEGE